MSRTMTTDAAERAFVAEMLRSGARGLAADAVNAQSDAQPDIRSRYGDSTFGGWLSDTEVRIRYLAECVEADAPDLFAEYARWSAIAFAAREVPREDLYENLRCITLAIADRLPRNASTLTGATLATGMAAIETIPPPPPTFLASEQPFIHIARGFLAMLADGKARDAAALLKRAIDDGEMRVPDIYAWVFEPVMREIGRLWQLNELSVAEEHLISSHVTRLMSQVVQMGGTPDPNGHMLLALAPPGDLHDMGLRMVADFFEINGWDVHYLGANVPVQDVAPAVEAVHPDLIAISTSMAVHLSSLRAAVASARTARTQPEPRVLVGGRPFAVMPQLAGYVGADASAESASAAVRVGCELVGLETPFSIAPARDDNAAHPSEPTS
ncbi:MAG: cobalamin-dependent protein [Planctomycetota bacterium]